MASSVARVADLDCRAAAGRSTHSCNGGGATCVAPRGLPPLAAVRGTPAVRQRVGSSIWPSPGVGVRVGQAAGVAQCGQQCSRGALVVPRALDPTHLADAATALAAHLPLAYEPVALPCSMMKCGDVVHRSTLDLVLRGETTGPDWRTFLLLATVGAYMFAPPGVLPGAFDYYVLSKLRNGKVYGKNDIVMGRKLATGGFGTVFLGEMRLESGELVPVIVKKAKEFGQAEAWMNERMMRLGGKHAAEFITAFDETMTQEVALGAGARKGKAGPPGSDAVWLVWRYEGRSNLMDMMESKDFPYNLEPLLLDRELRLPKGIARRAVTIRLVLKQLLEALEAAHNSGIVHRDVKPQNCIISERDKKIKVIDLGAAADLRIGINYAPAEYLMDPRYAPPQQYVMSTQTAEPPPPPVAAFLSPVLWRMESPDRFDMWSCGVTLLQMVFPSLRSDNAIVAFNERLAALKYDLRAWRREEEARKGGMKPDMEEGFALLDMDGGAGWTLLCDLMAYKPKDRCSASEALLSPFFTGSGITQPSGPAAAAALLPNALTGATKAVNKVLSNEVLSSFASSATGENRGSLTEAQLRQELGLEQVPELAPRRASNTIAWWQERQSELRRSIEKREGSQGTGGLPMRNGSRGSGSSGKAPVVPAPPKGRAAARNLNGVLAEGNGDGKSNGSVRLAGLLGGLTGGLKKVGASPNGRNGRGVAAASTDDDTSATPLRRRAAAAREATPERDVELVGAARKAGFTDLMGLLQRRK